MYHGSSRVGGASFSSWNSLVNSAKAPFPGGLTCSTNSHVARHIERSIRAGAVGKIGNRQQLATAYVGTRRVRVIAPGEEKALFAALRLFPFAALGQTLACPFSESARIQMWIIETTADITVL